MRDSGQGGTSSSSSNRFNSSSPEGSYSRLPTNDTPEPVEYESTNRSNHPYSYDYEAGTTRSPTSNPLSNVFTSATRLRGGKQKLLWLTAVACLIYLVHTIRSAEDDDHSWHPHLSTPASSLEDSQQPDLDIYEPPLRPSPPSSPPPSTYSSDNNHNKLPSEINVEAFVQPRRKVPPSSPDPWISVTSNQFKGREYLSHDRFGGTTSSSGEWFPQGKGMKDPPRNSNDHHYYNSSPPSRYILKSFEFSLKWIERQWKQMGMGKGSSFDKVTGRVGMVDRKYLKWKGRQNWELPLGDSYKVSELGSYNDSKKKMKNVQVQVEEVIEKDGSREEFEKREQERIERRDWVKRAFLHAWEGYKRHAWGHDELSPVSNLWVDNYNGWGATLVDNLDTLLIMNLSHEYNLARKHVSEIDFTYLVPSSSHFFETSQLPPLASLDVEPDPSIDYDNLPDSSSSEDYKQWSTGSKLKSSYSPFSPTTIPLFETTIRYLGGLISAYDLSGGDPLMLSRARELGDWLLPSLNTDWGLAVPRYKIGMNPDGGPSGRAVLAEVGSLGMELIRLSMITKDETYYIAAQRAMDTLENRFTKSSPVTSSGTGKIRGRLGSLLPSHVNANQPGMVQGEYTFGGLADSYYEYLIKQAQLTLFSNQQFERMYSKAIDSAYEYLIKPIESIPGREKDLITIGTMNWGSYRHELQHLTCFAGGMLGLGAKLLNRPRDLETAKNFTEACVWVYESSSTGIGGEQTTFYDKDDASRFVSNTLPNGTISETPRGEPFGVRTSNRKQIGRPETIESVFYMWRLTGDREWQDKGWTMFVNWVEHSITESGFATVGDVNRKPVRKDDSMESFVTAETLKYYYLLFSPLDFISLDDFTFNTEAHPFLIPKSTTRPEPLWTGPEESFETDGGGEGGGFVSQIGEGTWVQKWSRVLQASKLASILRNEALEERKKKKNGGGGWFGGRFGGSSGGGGGKTKGKELDEQVAPLVKMRKPIRPSEEELERARKGDNVVAEGGAAVRGKLKGQAWMAEGGGGKGMGGGAPPRS